MVTTIQIHSERHFSIDDFFAYLSVPQMIFDFQSQASQIYYWYFHHQEHSNTLFSICYYPANALYEISMDNLSSYADYKFFPYLIDTLVDFLQGTIITDHTEEQQSIYQLLDEEWIERTIADEIALLKATLSVTSHYYLAQPIDDMSFITLDVLYPYGVNLHSSTPRIYGYLQYLMKHHLLPADQIENDSNNESYLSEDEEESIEVDIPQHLPIGRVKSWQLDGSETYETYSQEDIEQLLALAKRFQEGTPLAGVVLNDIGTLHQEGIGMPINGKAAIYWFTKAYEAGDHLYAPTNLGDLYRKGCGNVRSQLDKAFNAYTLSTDPYAHYRIGQAYEEGWTGEKNLELALSWYKQSAKEGHHLAIKKLQSISQ